ncbi:hypothetical protein GCM10022215_13110 [Nocardioides fonticola]|uniref:Uncharacterized protein n=1 Tax=Nocardioides fonticola TaxID=450363 RepID=A0ABP7XFM4_9ACTN
MPAPLNALHRAAGSQPPCKACGAPVILISTPAPAVGGFRAMVPARRCTDPDCDTNVLSARAGGHDV